MLTNKLLRVVGGLMHGQTGREPYRTYTRREIGGGLWTSEGPPFRLFGVKVIPPFSRNIVYTLCVWVLCNDEWFDRIGPIYAFCLLINNTTAEICRFQPLYGKPVMQSISYLRYTFLFEPLNMIVGRCGPISVGGRQ